MHLKRELCRKNCYRRVALSEDHIEKKGQQGVADTALLHWRIFKNLPID
jgi:hypothetical protein